MTAPAPSTPDHPRDQVLAVLREHLLTPAAVTMRFRGLDVLGRSPEGLAVLFRWHDDPTTCAVAIPVARDDGGGSDDLVLALADQRWPDLSV